MVLILPYAYASAAEGPGQSASRRAGGHLGRDGRRGVRPRSPSSSRPRPAWRSSWRGDAGRESRIRPRALAMLSAFLAYGVAWSLDPAIPRDGETVRPAVSAPPADRPGAALQLVEARGRRGVGPALGPGGQAQGGRLVGGVLLLRPAWRGRSTCTARAGSTTGIRPWRWPGVVAGALALIGLGAAPAWRRSRASIAIFASWPCPWPRRPGDRGRRGRPGRGAMGKRKARLGQFGGLILSSWVHRSFPMVNEAGASSGYAAPDALAARGLLPRPLLGGGRLSSPRGDVGGESTDSSGKSPRTSPGAAHRCCWSIATRPAPR